MKYQKSALLLALLATLSPLSAKDIPVVPYPKQVSTSKAAPFVLADGYTIGCSDEFADAAKLFIQDATELYDVKGEMTDGKGMITLKKGKGMADEAYMLKVTAEGITIIAGNYNSMVMGMTTILQMVNAKTKSVVACTIKDAPKFEFRAHMIDLAREFTELETIKQLVDVCRWYKNRYLHLHLSDDQMFTFESKLYPKLTQGSQHYTQEQLKDLVAYATQRGVILIPEFDLPGHSSAMRNQMPELFGKGEWSVVDVVNPECMKAIKEITKEMMDIFHTSPYFHIGGDEAWFGAYEQQEHVKKFLADNKSDYDGVHDLQLKFVLDMHEFIKSQGKETLIWESFHGTGSAKFPMPKDLIVLAWETYYNPPQNLIENGYRIINAPWKPGYTTREHRWSPEYIYNWNPRRWENWAVNPQAPPTPIQMKSDKQIMGVQTCAWEMIDHEQLLTSCVRIPAFAEQGWNDEKKTSFKSYEARYKAAESKLMTLIFPAKDESKGFKAADPNYVDHGRIFEFVEEGKPFFKPLNPTDKIYYTTDLRFPTTKSKELTEPLSIKNDVVMKFAMYDAEGNLRGYKTCYYQHRPIDFKQDGLIPMIDLRSIVQAKGGVTRRQFYKGDKVKIALTNGMPGTTLRYTMNGQRPNNDSPVYSKPVVIDNKTFEANANRNENDEPTQLNFHAASVDADGNCVGQVFYAEYSRINK